MLDVLNFGQDLETASPYPRLHDQLIPEVLLHEPLFPKDIVNGLADKGHLMLESTMSAVVQAIFVDDNGLVHAASDHRKGGKPDGY